MWDLMNEKYFGIAFFIGLSGFYSVSFIILEFL